MYTLYVIRNTVNRQYVGITQNLSQRLRDHFIGKVRSTKARRPYELVYIEKYSTYREARKREIQIKKSGLLRKMIMRGEKLNRSIPQGPIV